MCVLKASILSHCLSHRISCRTLLRIFAHLYIEVFKSHSVSPQQLYGVPGHEADPKETLHLVTARPLGHLGDTEEADMKK